MKITRRALIAAIAVAPALPALAHHGWRWTAEGKVELTGIITEAQLGNPHGVLTVDAEDEVWQVEVGQPWRNARAGLEDSMLVPGVEIIAVGPRSANEAENLLKAERIVIAGQNYDLYPGRL